MPDAFLPVAEQTGLIEPLTRMGRSRPRLRQVVALGRRQGCDLAVAVNVSARNLSQATFADTVLAALAVHDVAATSLTVEITETALLTDVTRATDNLVRLAAAGVPVSVDDFGRGQTSLGLPLAAAAPRAEDRPKLRHRPARGRRARSDRPLGRRAVAQPRATSSSPKASRTTRRSSGCATLGLRHRAGLRHRPADAGRRSAGLARARGYGASDGLTAV